MILILSSFRDSRMKFGSFIIIEKKTNMCGSNKFFNLSFFATVFIYALISPHYCCFKQNIQIWGSHLGFLALLFFCVLPSPLEKRPEGTRKWSNKHEGRELQTFAACLLLSLLFWSWLVFHFLLILLWFRRAVSHFTTFFEFPLLWICWDFGDGSARIATYSPYDMGIFQPLFIMIHQGLMI